jgi:hypothetical protein
VEEVITAQQNLAIAQGHVVRAHVTYAKALIQYEEVTGTLLERHNIKMSEAVNGEIRYVPNGLARTSRRSSEFEVRKGYR